MFKKNKDKTERKFISYLKGVEIFPNVVRTSYKGKISSIEGYDSGFWWIQDIGSYIQFEILLKKMTTNFKNFNIKNINVLDLCAAPGGKTTQILDSGMNVLSLDNNLNRIKIMIQNLKRLQLKSTIVCHDATKIKVKKKFDVIIVDAPCSSTGTIRKNPDILLRNKPSNCKNLIETQMKILSNANKLLKKNGMLMYIVCSLEKIESEKIIKDFCNQNKNFQIIPISRSDLDFKKMSILTSDGFLRLLPNSLIFSKNKLLNGSDGFFSAILRKN